MDTTGCANGHSIETSNGRSVDVQNLLDDDITLPVIAHSLARQCRYGGHCRTWISVAEHSCHVADWMDQVVFYKTPADRQHTYEVMRAAALLHDASEAYLVDLPRPLKLLFPEYVALEKKVQTRIYERFGIIPSDELLELIKEGDNAVLKGEALLEMPSRGEKWGMEQLLPKHIGVERWSIERAESEFLNRAAMWM